MPLLGITLNVNQKQPSVFKRKKCVKKMTEVANISVCADEFTVGKDTVRYIYILTMGFNKRKENRLSKARTLEVDI